MAARSQPGLPRDAVTGPSCERSLETEFRCGSSLGAENSKYKLFYKSLLGKWLKGSKSIRKRRLSINFLIHISM